MCIEQVDECCGPQGTGYGPVVQTGQVQPGPTGVGGSVGLDEAAQPAGGEEPYRLQVQDQVRRCDGELGPVGFQNSATAADQRFQAARSYSLIRPPRIGRRLIRVLAAS